MPILEIAFKATLLCSGTSQIEEARMFMLRLSVTRGMSSSTEIRICRLALSIALVIGALLSACIPVAAQSRVLGLDVSRWQGNISQSTWNNIYNLENRDFVFIRATRGGTTGEDHRQGGYPGNDNTFHNLSQRYDDPYFVQNITQATNAGLLSGPYHYSRHDIIASTPNSGGIANTGEDEANHFIDMAGAWMRPGYLLPVYDLEGPLTRTNNQLAQFLIDFSDRMHAEMGIRPTMYINGSYSTVLQNASSSLRNQVVQGFPNLWDARYAYQATPESPNKPNSSEVQTAHPKDTFSGFYGPWDDAGETHPWTFWQYASTGRLQSFNNGNSNLDFNVAQGGIEFLKDNLVPALWMNNSDGQWTTLANWNSGQAPVAPVQGPGQLPRLGPLTLPSVRLPAADDTVILDRSSANITITLASGAHNIRKLEVREALNITGGSLTINYVPSADSTPLSARFSAPVALSGGSMSVHTLQVDATQTFSIGGGTLTLDTIELERHGTTPATLALTDDVNFNPLSGVAAKIINGSGSGSSGLIDLGGVERVLNVSDGAASVDLSIDVPITGGALTKTGAGTLALTAANYYSGDTTIQEGKLSIDSAFLSNTADVYLFTGAKFDLDFVGTAVIDSLFVDGVSLPAGIWGAAGSGAQFISPLISGDGVLYVSTFIPPPLLGDFDLDGDVDGEDFLVWQRDPNVGNLVDWQTHYGDVAPFAASSTAVPEPSSTMLILAVACCCFPLKRRVRLRL